MAAALSPDQTNLDSFLDCSLCLSTYRKPKGLPCLHSFCLECLVEYVLKNKVLWLDTLPCPLCRQPFNIPLEGVNSLPSNFFIHSLLELDDKRKKRKQEHERRSRAVAVAVDSPVGSGKREGDQHGNREGYQHGKTEGDEHGRTERLSQPMLNIQRLIGDTTTQSNNQGTPRMILGFSKKGFPSEQQFTIVDLDRPGSVSVNPCACLPVTIGNESATCILDNVLYAAGIGQECKQLWKWSGYDRKWARCADLPAVRRLHTLTSTNNTIHMLGGWESVNLRAVDTMFSYDTTTNLWTRNALKLGFAVNSATSAADENFIHLFGGYNKFNSFSNRVQKIDLTLTGYFRNVTSPIIPRKMNHMKAVQWKKGIFILMGSNTCFVYDPSKSNWEERERFKTGKAKFSLTLHEDMLYLVSKIDRTDTYEVIRIEVLNIIEDRTGPWKRHATITIQGELNLSCTQPLFL